MPHGLTELEAAAPEQAPAEQEAVAPEVEPAPPEGSTAQVVEQVCRVATADREYCMYVHRTMLFACLLVLVPAMWILRK